MKRQYMVHAVVKSFAKGVVTQGPGIKALIREALYWRLGSICIKCKGGGCRAVVTAMIGQLHSVVMMHVVGLNVL